MFTESSVFKKYILSDFVRFALNNAHFSLCVRECGCLASVSVDDIPDMINVSLAEFQTLSF